MGNRNDSFDYDKVPKEDWGYYLFLEGIANELMHVLQQKRKDIKLDLVDWIDVGIVEQSTTKLTSAIHVFVDSIVDRCRIRLFSPRPIEVDGTRLWKDEVVDGALNSKFTFDLYMRKNNELVPKEETNNGTSSSE